MKNIIKKEKSIAQLRNNNILNYDIKKDGVGRSGVLKVTGPIVYTQSIQPLLSHYNHKIYKTNDYSGLVYNNLYSNFFNSHRMFFTKKHYSKLSTPIIK